MGGLGLNAITGPAQVEAFIASLPAHPHADAGPEGPRHHAPDDPCVLERLTETKDLLKGRHDGDPHPMVDPQGFREQLDALQAGAEQRLVVERAKTPN